MPAPRRFWRSTSRAPARSASGCRTRLMCFLAPPSWEELERRLVGRGTEGPEERERRLATARTELAAEPEFDVTIVNTDVETACQELVDLFRSGTSRVDS